MSAAEAARVASDEAWTGQEADRLVEARQVSAQRMAHIVEQQQQQARHEQEQRQPAYHQPQEPRQYQEPRPASQHYGVRSAHDMDNPIPSAVHQPQHPAADESLVRLVSELVAAALANRGQLDGQLPRQPPANHQLQELPQLQQQPRLANQLHGAAANPVRADGYRPAAVPAIPGQHGAQPLLQLPPPQPSGTDEIYYYKRQRTKFYVDALAGFDVYGQFDHHYTSLNRLAGWRQNPSVMAAALRESSALLLSVAREQVVLEQYLDVVPLDARLSNAKPTTLCKNVPAVDKKLLDDVFKIIKPLHRTKQVLTAVRMALNAADTNNPASMRRLLDQVLDATIGIDDVVTFTIETIGALVNERALTSYREHIGAGPSTVAG